MSKTRLLIHIVFATKNREKSLPKNVKRELYAYIMGIINNHNSTLIRINGIEDHVHILLDLNPTVAVSDLVKEIKQSSSAWLRTNRHFPWFQGWGRGYYAVSIGEDGVEPCRQYIINQEEHHRVILFNEELKRIVDEYGLAWYEDDLD